ncbi:hypothetical protein HHI36_015549 [Cryptolaemus montrouzieri]|uniref:C2H2-type domain-containing protein n=1 Tax=Cryptolaemus montrouzieri TaxID=559131 RepID=A0ABD2N615_9CUCU
MERHCVVEENFKYDFKFIQHDENQNDISIKIKNELHETDQYQEDLECILNYAKEIHASNNYLMKDEVKEEPKFDQIFIEQASFKEEDSKLGQIAMESCQDIPSSSVSKISEIIKNEEEIVRIAYTCDYCKFETTDLAVLKIHSENHSQNFNLLNGRSKKTHFRKCSYCNYRAEDKNDWDNHRAAQHSKSMTRKCRFCDFITNTASKLKLHMNRHTKELLFKCQYCTYETVLSGHLKRHINSVHIKTTKYPCRYCDFTTTTFSSVKRHIENKHGKIVISGKVNSNNEPKIKCDDETKGIEDEPYEGLSKKGRVFKGQQFQCQYCEYQTPFCDYLNIHINSRHTRKTLYKCQYCEYEATKLYTLRCHVNSKHTRKVIYKCELCNLETTRSNILKRHIQRIHVEKSFKCQYCVYVAKKEGHLRKHISKKHIIQCQKEELQDNIKVEPGLITIEDIKVKPELVKIESIEEIF